MGRSLDNPDRSDALLDHRPLTRATQGIADRRAQAIPASSTTVPGAASVRSNNDDDAGNITT